ncbi:MAG: large repetitive protein [Verrucomicrobiota bacterium]|jgi:hypothetical protein
MRTFCSIVLIALCGARLRADSFVVTTVADSGPGSLRQAITDANAHPNASATERDIIAFAIPADGVVTIAPATSLPAITDPVIIDGYTQAGSMPNTNSVTHGLNGKLTVMLTGVNIPLFSNLSVGLTISSGHTTVRGLIINVFFTAILAKGGGSNIISGNYIGTDPSGEFAPKTPPNASEDIQNVGIRLEDSSDNRIGGTTPDSRNLLSANKLADIVVTGFGSKNNVIQGNIMGLKASGTLVLRADNYFGSSTNVWLERGASENLIGGTTPEARNVMGGFALFGNHVGVSTSPVDGPQASRTVIKGNFLGLDVTGTMRTDTLSAPGGIGIILRDNANVVGGPEPGARNIISGNPAGGIIVSQNFNTGGLASKNIIQGNFIGTDVSGLRAVPNGRYGVEITGNCSDNMIGGIEPGAGNVIAYHPLHGIELHQGFPTSGTRNAILGNSIYANGRLGIDLNDDGVTPNDEGDGDTDRPNNLQNYPALDSADFVGDKTRVRGTLHSEPNKTYRIEVFADMASDASGFGEGRVFLGAVAATTDPGGLAGFDLALTSPAGSRIITSTATDPDGNTSEFSRSIPIAGSPPAQLLNISSRAHVGTGNDLLIAGLILGGPEEKRIVFRALGPSLLESGVTDAMANPTLVLFDSSGTVIAANDEWKEGQRAEIENAGLAPGNDHESALAATLKPNQPYTVVVEGYGGGSGNALVEAYAIDQNSYSQLLNISTRAFVGRDDAVLIGGLIAGGGNQGTSVVIRGIGPTLKMSGIANPLLDPILELHDENGGLLAMNDDWKQSQVSEILATGLAPAEDAEAAILTILPAGKATAIVRGKSDSVGVGLVEIYDVR